MNRKRLRVVALAAILCHIHSRRRMWVHEFFKGRPKYGEYKKVFLELKHNLHIESYARKFFEYTRMNWGTFQKLLGLLEARLRKFSCRQPIGIEERLVITLRFLSTGNSYRSMAFSFRVPHNTISKIVAETCYAIWDNLAPIYLKFPTSELQWKEIANDFHVRWNVPNMLGAIDGKHVLLKKPAKTEALFYNYKQTFSIVLLGVCDSKYQFLFVDIGGFGHQGDANLFSTSDFKKMVESAESKIPSEDKLPGSDLSINYFFAGDSAFPLMDYLMKPFSGANVSKEHRIYNYRLSRARRTIENAFGILAHRWRIFLKPIETTSEHAILITKAACCLHNFCIKELEWNLNPIRLADNGDEMDGEWRRQTQPLESAQVRRPHSSKSRDSALQMREKLLQYFNNEGKVPWQDSKI